MNDCFQPEGGGKDSDALPWRLNVKRVAVFLFLLVAGLYIGTLWNEFTNDDEIVYSRNPFVHERDGLQRLFTGDYFAVSGEASYRPVVTFSYIVDAWIWGGLTAGPHATNVFLFAVAVVLFYFFVIGISGCFRVGLWAALLYAVHPLGSTVVNSIGFREDILAAIGILLSWHWCAGFLRTRRVGFLVYGCLAYLVALLSKESALVFPLLVVILIFFLTHEKNAVGFRGKLVCLAGLLVVTGAFLWLRFVAMPGPEEGAVSRLGGSWVGTILADIKIHAWYIRLAFFPVGLSPWYPAAMYEPAVDIPFLLSLCILGLPLALLFGFWRERLVLFSLLWWFGFLAPVSNLYPIFNPMADRYLLLPLMGFCLMGGVFADRLLGGGRARMVFPCLVCILLFYGMITMRENTFWRNHRVLWTHVDRQFPNQGLVLATLASSQYAEGNLAQARELALRSLSCGVDQADERKARATAYLVFGCVEHRGGRLEAAWASFLEAEKWLPTQQYLMALVYRNIGLMHDARGEVDQALQYFNWALSNDPYSEDLWRKKTWCHLALGEQTEAWKSWEQARRRNPALEPLEAVLKEEAGSSAP